MKQDILDEINAYFASTGEYYRYNQGAATIAGNFDLEVLAERIVEVVKYHDQG